MSKITFNNQEMHNLKSETVLDTLLRHNIDVPFSCKSGLCQTCMLQASKGDVPESSQKELKDTLKQQNYFLPCNCIPTEDIEVKLPNKNEVYSPAILLSKEMLAPDICRLIIEPVSPLYYHAGQFINLRKNNNLIRSYSLASLPQTDNALEFHIKRMPGGKMSSWLIDKFNIGDKIDFQGPFGNCFYTTDSSTSTPDNNNLILIGTGTGLAPLLGIIKDALHNQHHGEIYFYHGSRYYSGLYLQDDLKKLGQSHNNFHYIPCLSGENIPKDMGILEGRADKIALQEHKDLASCKVYLCGAPPMVNNTKKMAYLAGAKLNNIYADPFELTELRNQSRD
ncbi:MAG: FAD-binding oxidoreductase [Woeseiaceae bacterium]